MAEHFTRKYIPTGCLLISNTVRNSLPLTSISANSGQTWYFFKRQSDDLPESLSLPAELQVTLLASPVLAPFAFLWSQQWIQLAYAHVPARVRVYVLPHDVNGSVRGSRDQLSKSMSALFHRLEYSGDCWQGRAVYAHQPEPCQGHDVSCQSDSSLLTLFNQVPSPDPRPETASDPVTQWIMRCLVEGQVPGLITTLYPYQGRSAALMLQRELEPGRVVDPRLRLVLDQAGKPWYCDDLSGLALKEPRFYDEARGGILAEEMGTGKTLICLALVLSTKSEPSKPPDPFIAETPPRETLGSLMDIAAATANRHSIPWKPYFEACAAQFGYEYEQCKGVMNRPENRALYRVTTNTQPRRSSRLAPPVSNSKEVFLSYATLIIVPGNLVKQWQNEIKKHTTGLHVLVLVNQDPIPPIGELLSYDIILFSDTRFSRIRKDRQNGEGPLLDVYCPLEYIQFKRCIIDEGHKLGNGGRTWKNDVMRAMEGLQISARWVVTGTPSRGLYGVQSHELGESRDTSNRSSPDSDSDTAQKLEQQDLQRIGNLAAKYLMVRPWANVKNEAGGDTCADWAMYISKGYNRKDCVVNALNSLLVRHQLSDIATLLPPVDEKIVVLDGSFQDQLSLNLFSMMIIFNAVQSQRTGVDYLFHERQRANLAQLTKNLRQSCFFGGAFFSAEEISKAVETAEGFLESKSIPISAEDEDLLKQAVEFGKLAAKNELKNISNCFHAMPIYVQDFPGGSGKSWSLDGKETGEDGLVCTDAGLIHALQAFLNPCIDAPASLQLMIDTGRLDRQGIAERTSALSRASDAGGNNGTQTPQMAALAGHTLLGGDHHITPRSRDPVDQMEEPADLENHVEVAKPLTKTRIVSTISAKMSYLIDSITKYQDNEQILIFYDNDNVAFYLASVLDILQIQHLIYSKAGLNAERRAQYVASFTNSPKFRVLLMDISQAAFGLDMRSASRIYFISPVLNPQVVAQAIGRARRISQKKPVSVETLVLRNSIEEVMMDRREHMSQAEHSKVKNVLDDGKIKEWIRNPKIHSMSEVNEALPLEQTALLSSPQHIFGRGFGRARHPDEGLITDSPVARIKPNTTTNSHEGLRNPTRFDRGLKRTISPGEDPEILNNTRPEKRQKRIAWAD
ncbi:SNF2 family N-terminal domain-containing protein [Xylaria intraflava]|nr:SNF2 family N-terminal domain-containing protein [Xylaria intraflava]